MRCPSRPVGAYSRCSVNSSGRSGPSSSRSASTSIQTACGYTSTVSRVPDWSRATAPVRLVGDRVMPGPSRLTRGREGIRLAPTAILAVGLRAQCDRASAGCERSRPPDERSDESSPRGRGPPHEALETTLVALGFQPRIQGRTDDRLAICLRNCPYRDVVRENQPVVCTLHRGITRGLLDVLHPAAELAEFVPRDPDEAGCLIELRGIRDGVAS